MLMVAIYAGWMRAQQASRHFVFAVIFEIDGIFRDAALRASFGCLILAHVLRAVPDQHGIGLALDLNFVLWAHSTFVFFALVRAFGASGELACKAPRARCFVHFLLVALYTRPL